MSPNPIHASSKGGRLRPPFLHSPKRELHGVETHPAPTGRKMHKSAGILKKFIFPQGKGLDGGRISVYLSLIHI